VSEVVPNSPAAKAGLSAGDVLVQINDVPLSDLSREAISMVRIVWLLFMSFYIAVFRNGVIEKNKLLLTRFKVIPHAINAPCY